MLLLISLIGYTIYVYNCETYASAIIHSNIQNSNNKIIFTITTYFDFKKENKWNVFCNGIDSILKFHPNIYNIMDFYIINEYSDEPLDNWKNKINKKYPFVTFIQKTKKDKGQGKSLNLILDIIQNYTYWIHWEEAWFPTRQFLYDAIEIMDTTNITQLQFTQEAGNTHWNDKPNRCYNFNKNNYCIINYFIEEYPKIDIYKEFSHHDWMTLNWPLYSIRPSINRVRDYNFGKFLTTPELWPLKFEIEFGERWMERNYVKGIFENGPVRRNTTHVSTYK